MKGARGGVMAPSKLARNGGCMERNEVREGSSSLFEWRGMEKGGERREARGREKWVEKTGRRGRELRYEPGQEALCLPTSTLQSAMPFMPLPPPAGALRHRTDSSGSLLQERSRGRHKRGYRDARPRHQHATSTSARTTRRSSRTSPHACPSITP